MAELRLLAIADDLTGAGEVASACGAGTRVVLDTPTPEQWDELQRHNTSALVVDTGTRDADPEDAATVITSLTREIPDVITVFKKVDSLLRGNTGAEIKALSARSPVVLAPALPDMDRTVEGGILRIARRALVETTLWDHEKNPAPERVADLFPHTDVAEISIDDIRAGRLNALQQHRAGVLVCDAIADSDLDAIVSAAPLNAVLAGSRALAEALDRRDSVRAAPSQNTDIPASDRQVLVVVGTASSAAVEQIDELKSRGYPVIDLDPEHINVLDPDSHAANHVLVVSLAGSTPNAHAPHLAQDLAHAVAAIAVRRNLVLTGGETARKVLDVLDIRMLTHAATIEPGLVELAADSGRRVITRPGSFGSRYSLAQAIRHLTTPNARQRTHIRDR